MRGKQFSEKDIKDITILSESGKRHKEIAKKYGVNKCVIQRLCQKNGIKNCRQIDYTGKKFNKLLIIKQYKPFKLSRQFVYCKCDCGVETKTSLSKVVLGLVKSCGCIRKGMPQPKIRKGFGVSSFNKLYDSYKRRSKIKCIEFKISKSFAKKLYKKNCYYCGVEPSSICKLKGGYGHFIYNGIDRMDNEKGYVSDNCIPCCTLCNYLKNNMHISEFCKIINKISENLKNKINMNDIDQLKLKQEELSKELLAVIYKISELQLKSSPDHVYWLDGKEFLSKHEVTGLDIRMNMPANARRTVFIENMGNYPDLQIKDSDKIPNGARLYTVPDGIMGG